MEAQTKAFGALISAARSWAKTRARLRRLADSRKATEGDIKKAHAANQRSAKKLELAVKRFDDATRGMIPRSRTKKVNWAEVAGAVAKIAGGVEQAVKGNHVLPPSAGTVGFTEVIEVDGVPVKSP